MDIELQHSFKYHHNNDEYDAKFIKISAFTMKQMGLVAPVKEIVMKAMGKLVENVQVSNVDIEKAKAGTENVDSSGLLAVVAMNCDEGAYGKLLVHMEKLLASGVAYIDGEVKLNGTWLPQMNPADFENLCGEYIGNFIVS